MVYIDVYVQSNMEQIQQFNQEQEVILEKSIGNLFEEYLTKKNRLAEFDNLAENVMVTISNDGGRIFEVVRGTGGFPAKVKDILAMVIKPTQEIIFRKRIAGG